MAQPNYSSTLKVLVARNLNQFMIDCGKSRRDVSNDLNIKYTTLCDWVNGKSTPKLDNLEELSIYLDVSVADFFVEHEKTNSSSVARIMNYAKKGRELSMKAVSEMSDKDIKMLLEDGYTFKHRTLEEYIAMSGKELVVSSEIDYGEVVGDEVW